MRDGGCVARESTSGVQTAAKTAAGDQPGADRRVVAPAGRVGDQVGRRSARRPPGPRRRCRSRRTRWPVIRAPSGSAKTTAETSSGCTTASRPMVSAIAWATKPSASRRSRPARPGAAPSAGAGPSSEPLRGRVDAGSLLQHGPEREEAARRPGRGRRPRPAHPTRAPGRRGPVAGGVIAAARARTLRWWPRARAGTRRPRARRRRSSGRRRHRLLLGVLVLLLGARFFGFTIFSDSGRSSSSPTDSSRSTSTVVPETIESGPWRSTSSASGSSM